jgi:hypothetical protein
METPGAPDSVDDPDRASLAALADWCRALPALPPPWDGLRPDADARGPVPDPGPTLAALRERTPDPALVGAGLLLPGPGGEARLAPELVNPAGALIFLRDGQPRPFAVLTARGCLPRGHCPLTAALRDGWTAARAAEWGALFASPHVREVVLLRALGLPATLAAGSAAYTAADFAALDARFAPPAVGPGAGPGPPVLVFVDWSVRAVSAARPPALTHALARLAAARQHLRLGFAGVTVWRPAPADLEALRFWLDLGDLAGARDLLRASADTLADFAAPAGPPPAPPPYPAALAELLAARAGDDPAAGVAAARAAYEAAVDRDLVSPLVAAAIADADPLARQVGVHLAAVAGPLHAAAPEVRSALTAALAGGQGGLKALELFQKLSARFAALAALLDRVRRP